MTVNDDTNEILSTGPWEHFGVHVYWQPETHLLTENNWDLNMDK